MAKMILPTSWTSFRDMVIMYLFRLVGAPIKIDHQVIVKPDPSLIFEGAVCLRFRNRGQFPVIIDEFEIVQPGGVYTEGDTAGPGIDHKYNIRFLKELAKNDLGPDSDPPYVFAGNYLEVRIFKRAT